MDGKLKIHLYHSREPHNNQLILTNKHLTILTRKYDRFSLCSMRNNFNNNVVITKI